MIGFSLAATWMIVLGWIMFSVIVGVLLGRILGKATVAESISSALGFTRFERFTHKFGWHSPLEPIDGDAMGQFRCLQCGKVGLVDSQGNLF